MSLVTESQTFSKEFNTRTYCIVAYNVILTIPIVAGNILIILVFGLYSSPEQRNSHMFIINMAVSDLIVGLALPFNVALHLDKYFRYDKYACFFISIVIGGALGQSIFSLTAISVDRFIAIFFPLKYVFYVTKTRVILLLIISWSIIAVMSAAPFIGKYYLNLLWSEFNSY